MGIKKIGDRVRIFVAIKQLRTKAVGNHKKRTRDSIAALDNRSQGAPMTPSSTSSPRHNTTRDRSLPTPSTANTASNRYSRQFDPAAFESFRAGESKGRPGSPLAETDARGLRAQRYGGRRPGTPNRQNVGMDSTVGKLPPNSPVIRVIYNSGQTKVLDIKNCNTAEEILLNVLKKLSLPEHHVKNYCFYTLDNPDQDPMSFHRMSDSELVRVCKDHRGNDRNRLILRKIHAGELRGTTCEKLLLSTMKSTMSCTPLLLRITLPTAGARRPRPWARLGIPSATPYLQLSASILKQPRLQLHSELIGIEATVM